MAISIRTFINDEATGTLNSTYLLGLTGMRGLAAILVMLFHMVSMANPRLLKINVFGLNMDFTFIFNTGWVGINIFFVLSGFLLGLPFIDWLNGKMDRPVTVEFYKRRCLRVLPAFYAQLIILFLLGYIGWYAKPSQFSTWLMHFFMLHNISPSASWEINGVYWTLPVEFNFYLLLPWLSYFFLHRMPNKLLAWLALLIGSMLIVSTYRYVVFH
jgi:peptidoglycan/LPS O-acetylase OafA/YrhL